MSTGLAHLLSHTSSTISVLTRVFPFSFDTDIVLDVWDNKWANPVDMVKQGFHIINANDNLLYIVPWAGYFNDYLDTRLLYERWEPYIFDFSNPAMNLQDRKSVV